MTKFAAALLYVVGLSLIVVGTAYLLDPAAMYGFYGGHLEGTVAYHFARTMPGGLHLAIGAALLGGAVRPKAPTLALRILVIYLCGIVFGRVASVAIDGSPPSSLLLPELILELPLLVLGLVMVRSRQA